MYDRFLSMLNSQECMIILSVVLFLFYYSIKNEKNASVNKMIILTIIVMSSNISKELTILLCILFIYLTFNRNKSVENFSIESSDNLIVNTDENWNRTGIQKYITDSDDHFIGKLDKVFIQGQPEIKTGDAITQIKVDSIKDNVCSSVRDNGFIASINPFNENNEVKERCTHNLRNDDGSLKTEQAVENITNEELELEMLKISECAKKINSDGYDEDAFASCAAATGKYFKNKCKITNKIDNLDYCYPREDKDTTQKVPNNTEEDKINVMDKMIKNQLPSITTYLPLKKYKLTESSDSNLSEVPVTMSNEDFADIEEFSHNNLDLIKQTYLTESTGRTGPPVQSDIPLTGFTKDSGSGSENNGFYYYKSNAATELERNRISDVDIVPQQKAGELSIIRQHLLNVGYRYVYQFDKSNNLSVLAGYADWLPNNMQGKVTFDTGFDYRRIEVFIDNTDSTDPTQQPSVELANKISLGYLGENFVNTLNNKIINTEQIPNNPNVTWLTFFSVNNSVVTMEQDDSPAAYHPKFMNQSMEMIVEDIREEVYIKYYPFDSSLTPGSKEHRDYTDEYFEQKNLWEDRTSKYIMRSIGCNRLRDPNLHSYGWWGRKLDDNGNIAISEDGKEIWQCRYQNKSDVTGTI